MLRYLLGLTLLFCAHVGHAADFDHANWDGLLKRHVVSVRGGVATQVDYGGMLAERKLLNAYLAATSAVSRADFDSWSKADQLSFLINVYNARTVELILTGYPKIASIRDTGSWMQSPWKRAFIPLLGETRTLDDIEHGLIRGSGRYNDPRIHFALNCASVGCPALRIGAYSGADLDGQLEAATRAFLSDRTRNRLEQGGLKLSSIFRWYRGDFEQGWRGRQNLHQFLAPYAASLGVPAAELTRLRSGATKITFLPYDWRLNRTP